MTKLEELKAARADVWAAYHAATVGVDLSF
jgi:hypothetical protein